uniref:Uncharacterized protein n=1 Tax=Cajanus cajan TaxID=3821 RepID=A0A151TPJ4_CAJCA|nr:hypothetical protein KK1_022613 [Cajanus cajan]
MISCPIYVSSSDYSVFQIFDNMDPSCTKMFDVITPMSADMMLSNSVNLRWSNPGCAKCEAQGKTCKWKSNSTEGDMECFDCKGKKGNHMLRSFLFTTCENRLFHTTYLK